MDSLNFHVDRWGTLRPPNPGRLPSDTPLSLAFRLPLGADSAASTQDPLARASMVAPVEAILFLADEPLPPGKIAQAAGLADAAAGRRALRKLQLLLEQDESPFQIEEVAGGFQLL